MKLYRSAFHEFFPLFFPNQLSPLFPYPLSSFAPPPILFPSLFFRLLKSLYAASSPRSIKVYSKQQFHIHSFRFVHVQ